MYPSDRFMLTKDSPILNVVVFLLSIKCLSLLAFSLVLSSCTASYTKDLVQKSLADLNLASEHRVERDAMWVVSAKTPVYLIKPVAIDSRKHTRALNILYSELDVALQRAFPDYQTINQELTLAQAFMMAKAQGSDLLFFPKLVAIENNLNTNHEIQEGRGLHPEKTMAPDRTTLQVLIYEVRTQRLIDVSILRSHNRLFSANGTEPSKLFHSAVVNYVRSISGKRLG